MSEQKHQKITLWTVLLNLDAIITAVTLTLATIIVNVNVITRYFLSKPLYWGEEVATGLFVWTVFIGSAYAFRKKAHLGVDILVNALPGKLRSVVKVIMDILVLFVLIMLTYVSTLYVYNTWDKLSNTLRVPSWYVSIAVPAGFGLSVLFGIYFMAKDAKQMLAGGKGDETA